MMSRPSRPCAIAFALAFPLLAASPVQAQDNAAAAEMLFRQGHQLYEQKHYAEACAKLHESFRLDPATGALLALATCHESEGKLASAWSEYVDTVARARRDGRADRAEAAQQRASALEPKLGRLTIHLAETSTPGVIVKRDGAALGAGSLGTPFPVDHGEHVIEANAPGFRTWTTRIAVDDGARETVTVPSLVPASAPAGGLEGSGAVTAHDGEAGSSGGFPTRTVGLLTGIAGLVGLGIGSGMGFVAIDKNNQSNANGHCLNDVCDALGKAARHDALGAGNASTALFVVGGVLLVGGVTLFVLGGSSGNASGGGSSGGSASAHVGPTGVSLQGTF